MKILGVVKMLDKIDKVVRNCMDSLKPIEITSKGGMHTASLSTRPYLLKTLAHFHKTVKADGNTYNLFPKDVNGKKHLAFNLTKAYSLKNPINCGQVELSELVEMFEKEAPELIAGMPKYLEQVLYLDDKYFSNLKVVVGGAYAPDKKLIERIRELGAKPYWTYGSTDFLDAFITGKDFEEGYYVHQGKFAKTLNGELTYLHPRFKKPIFTGDTGEIIERNGKQFIGTYSIKKVATP